MRVAIAADHAAMPLKTVLVAWLEQAGHDVLDLGTNSSASVDYPDYGFAIAEALADGRAERGVALCGSGIGIAIAANRHPACRCAQVSEPLSARLARSHNDANAIAMGARLIGETMAVACLEAFLAADFEGGRHQHRVDMLSAPRVAASPESDAPFTEERA
ncbi:ribose 5-phosphate isomerase B [Sphingomonas jinjuensis]|uniref:Ribose 5-phosphate isomerase B n=1 Tax=Sphingomonas jinjuensis TaxID=535907 RepID=A0A840F8M8_9SPHN|nr:ribose 5-phosphate isomerase B [Sphingomonas jinjuensis]MBB4152646.1 ribose 5-phosphate isomerase B [Sphingomonas jinjuensis]